MLRRRARAGPVSRRPARRWDPVPDGRARDAADADLTRFALLVSLVDVGPHLAYGAVTRPSPSDSTTTQGRDAPTISSLGTCPGALGDGEVTTAGGDSGARHPRLLTTVRLNALRTSRSDIKIRLLHADGGRRCAMPVSLAIGLALAVVLVALVVRGLRSGCRPVPRPRTAATLHEPARPISASQSSPRDRLADHGLHRLLHHADPRGRPDRPRCCHRSGDPPPRERDRDRRRGASRELDRPVDTAGRHRRLPVRDAPLRRDAPGADLALPEPSGAVPQRTTTAPER